MEHTEVKSDNARNVILNYNDKIYYVNGINVQLQEGVEKIRAVFHTKRASDNAVEDLNIEINQGIYDILLEYAKMDKLNLIMVLQIEGSKSKWCLLSEEWLKSQFRSIGAEAYIV